MLRRSLFMALLIFASLLASCAAPATNQPTQAHTSVPPSVTMPAPTPTAPKPSATPPSLKPSATSKFVIQKSLNQGAKGTPTPNPYLLSEAGPYQVGKRKFTATDPNRPAREISISVWYPALRESGEPSLSTILDGKPDMSGAPYPLLLSSTKLANIFAPYLVSHGFTWASIDGIDYTDVTNPEMIDQPLDILFALEQVASTPPQGLEGVIDAEHAGALGYSFDGYNALALSGARFDPEYYLALCADPDKTKETVPYWFDEKYHCGAAREWDQFSAAAGEGITSSQDGLWQPMTDPRIKAVMPMGADGLYIFGDRGLAEVKMPVLLLAATLGDEYPENTLILDKLGSAEKSLISVVGRTHMIILEPDIIPILRHFAVAFFGHHLQGRQDYAQYYSEQFVNQQEKLAWGVYPEP